MNRNPIDALARAKAWGLNVRQARYSEWGNFYGLLNKFPAVLLDAHGYYLVRTDEDLSVSGISVGKRINVPKRIETLPGYVKVEPNVFPDEIAPQESVWEGAKQSITVNVYERNRAARDACLRRWGTSCTVCGFNFGRVYGPGFADFIHVHHLVPISSVGERYKLDPENDLRPVCPNCHAVIHQRSPPYEVDEVKSFLQAARYPTSD